MTSLAHLRELSLFSGYCGFTLGLRLAGIPTKTIGYVEIDEYCQKLIQARIRDGYLDWAPIVKDIRSADFRPMAGLVDIVTGGFPCQPHSFAGKRRGAADERNLWPDTLRVIREVEPRYVLLENVPGILANGYGGTVVGELSEIGYNCLWHCVPAAAVGAPHLRWRWWLLAYPQQQRRTGREIHTGNKLTPLARGETGAFIPSGEIPHTANNGLRPQRWATEQERQHYPLERGELPGPDGKDGAVANAYQPGLAQRKEPELLGQCPPVERNGHGDAHANGESEDGLAESWGERGYWAVEPDVGRVADGCPDRVDRLKALGNGIVPLQLAYFLRRLSDVA